MFIISFIFIQSKALLYERGEVLRSYILALQALIQFAKENTLSCDFDFVSIICNLLFTRPFVCAATFDRFVDVRDLAINKVYEKWQEYLSSEDEVMNGSESNDSFSRILVVYQRDSNDNTEKVEKEITIPLSLLHAALVLLGNWNEEEESSNLSMMERNEEPRCTSVRNLARFLIEPISEVDDKSMVPGAAGAVLNESSKRAVSVDQVRQ